MECALGRKGIIYLCRKSTPEGAQEETEQDEVCGIRPLLNLIFSKTHAQGGLDIALELESPSPDLFKP